MAWVSTVALLLSSRARANTHATCETCANNLASRVVMHCVCIPLLPTTLCSTQQHAQQHAQQAQDSGASGLLKILGPLSRVCGGGVIQLPRHVCVCVELFCTEHGLDPQ